MVVFWQTIADYNAATWIFQAFIIVIAATLTFLLYVKPSEKVRTTMRIFMAFLNFWIAGVYYMVYCQPREYHGMMALFWAIMGSLWLYDIGVKRTSLERTGRHSRFALLLFVMPLLYPVTSLLLGRTWPMMTSPVMPCSVAVFTVGLMLAFSVRVNMVLAMFLCHWSLIGLSKVYFFGIPEDYILGCSIIPALYIFFREYIISISNERTKPSVRVLNILLITLCMMVGGLFTYTLFNQFDLFSKII